MSREKRRQFTADGKATILRRHLADKVPVREFTKPAHHLIQPTGHPPAQWSALGPGNPLG